MRQFCSPPHTFDFVGVLSDPVLINLDCYFASRRHLISVCLVLAYVLQYCNKPSPRTHRRTKIGTTF